MKEKQYLENNSKVFNDAVIRYELVESIENGCVSYSFVCKGYFNKTTNQEINLSFAPTGNGLITRLKNSFRRNIKNFKLWLG